jgi:hypothetical protein
MREVRADRNFSDNEFLGNESCCKERNENIYKFTNFRESSRILERCQAQYLLVLPPDSVTLLNHCGCHRIYLFILNCFLLETVAVILNNS